MKKIPSALYHLALSPSCAQRTMLHVLLGFGISLLAPATFAQSWQTVDDFQYVAGNYAQSSGLAVSPNCTLFASGTGSDASGGYGLVFASTDAGSTWFGPLDNYNYGPGFETDYDGGMVADSAGNLYVAGWTYYDGHWLVRRSTDGGATWSLVDDFFPGGFLTEPFGLTADAAGNIYVAGVVDPGTGSPMIWTVRKGVGGTSFSTVDSFSVNGSSQAQGIYAHPTAGIFAVGAATVPGTKGYFHTVAWVVRRSTNGGATWSTVDTFQLSQNVRSGAFGIGADAHGNLYVAGQGYVKSGPKNQYSHWIVRKSSTGGTSWTTVDNFQLSNSADSAAVGFAADSNGNLYTAGWGRAASSGNRHWIVRKNPGGAGAWSPDDDFQYMSGSDAEPFAITANASGKLFVGGAADSNSSTHWLVRKR